jgi:3-phytase
MRLLFVAASYVAGAVLVMSASPPPTFPHTVTLEGRLTHADYERLFEREFDVPEGTRRIEVGYTFTGGDRRTAIDLGLRGPAGLRGWGGSAAFPVSVSALSATPGYLPGPIEPGRWAVILGIPNIRKGSDDTYTVTVTMFDRDLAAPARVVRPGPGWYVGDLHAHSGHSDGRGQSRSGKAMRAAPHRVFDAAVAAKLDFLALTDHNTAAHWLDVDRLQPHYDDVLLLHGREVTTYRGHANTVGELAFTDFRLAAPDASPAPLLRSIASGGAFISINHPRVPDDETCMGCGWNVVDPAVMASVQGVEIVNGPLATGPLSGWSFWADLLTRGWRVTAVGGSDEHTPDDRADRNLGVPTTVVYARELSEPAIVEGLRSGRVYVRTQGPDGPVLEFTARAASAGPSTNGGTTHQMGGIISTSSPIDLVLEATLNRADGATVEWIRNGVAFAQTPVAPGPITQSVRGAAPGDWFSLIVRRGETPLAFANAIYVRAAAPLAPAIVSEPVPHDSEDVAFWIDRADPAKSLIIATDKHETDGGLYAYDVNGQLKLEPAIRGVRRPNNVDVEYGLPFQGATIDIAVTTERGANRLRVHRLPELTAVDSGGIDVFAGVDQRLPMGMALYKRPSDGAIFAIVSRSTGPSGSYLWQYRLQEAGGRVTATKVREFGVYSGRKTMESLAVDDELGYVYASDEQVGVRKYHADPDAPDANRELALFATTGFAEDHEGISIYPTGPGRGYIIVSDQGAKRFHLFRREGDAGSPHVHPDLGIVDVAAFDADGSDVTPVAIGPRFPEGALVTMSGDRTYHFYSWRDLIARIGR